MIKKSLIIHLRKIGQKRMFSYNLKNKDTKKKFGSLKKKRVFSIFSKIILKSNFQKLFLKAIFKNSFECFIYFTVCIEKLLYFISF